MCKLSIAGKAKNFDFAITFWNMWATNLEIFYTISTNAMCNTFSEDDRDAHREN